MDQIFYKKWNSVLVVASIILIILLLCVLLTFLAQKSSFDQRTEKINALIEQAKLDIETQQKIIEYKQTDRYIIDWAIEQGLVDINDYLFVEKAN